MFVEGVLREVVPDGGRQEEESAFGSECEINKKKTF